MRSAVETAFRSCPAEDFVLLKLTYLAELRAAEVAKMFGCSRSTIDRQVEVAGRGIERVALQSIKARDPWLEFAVVGFRRAWPHGDAGVLRDGRGF